MNTDMVERLDLESLITSKDKAYSSAGKMIALYFLRTYDDLTLPKICKKSSAQALLHAYQIKSDWQEILSFTNKGDFGCSKKLNDIQKQINNLMEIQVASENHAGKGSNLSALSQAMVALGTDLNK